MNKAHTGKIPLARWIYIIVAIDRLKNIPLTRIARKLDMTQTWAHLVLVELEKKGLVEKYKIGRVNKLSFTEKGLTVLHACKILIREIEGEDHWLVVKK